MKLVALVLLIMALAVPAGASSLVSWTQTDIPGHNLTLNYTSAFNVAKDDVLGISIRNMGNAGNDTITVNKINVSDTANAAGSMEGSWAIPPGSSRTINFTLNMTANDAVDLDIRIHYNVSSENKTLSVTAKYPGAPEITSSDNSRTGKKKNDAVLDWYPEVVDNVYVDGTVNKTVEYSITTAEEMAVFNWTVDGNTVNGYADGSTYHYEHTWDNSSPGAHTVIFKGSNNDTGVEFRWYVNVYLTGEVYCSGSILDVIDDALEKHVTDVKIRMFRYQIAKHGKSEIAVRKVNQLHDEIAKRQMTREALRAEFKAGNITSEQYTAAVKRVQREDEYNSKLAEGYAKISIEDLKDDKGKDGANSKGNEDAGEGKSNGNNKDSERKNSGRGRD